MGASTGSGRRREPASRRTGPSTRAERRDLLVVATRALAALPERDAELVRHLMHGLPISETASRLSITPEAAQRARLRAVERLKKVFALARARAG
jgi:DNA-directed RNA polymerase specialized sigma24 family protein